MYYGADDFNSANLSGFYPHAQLNIKYANNSFRVHFRVKEARNIV